MIRTLTLLTLLSTVLAAGPASADFVDDTLAQIPPMSTPPPGDGDGGDGEPFLLLPDAGAVLSRDPDAPLLVVGGECADRGVTVACDASSCVGFPLAWAPCSGPTICLLGSSGRCDVGENTGLVIEQLDIWLHRVGPDPSPYPHLFDVAHPQPPGVVSVGGSCGERGVSLSCDYVAPPGTECLHVAGDPRDPSSFNVPCGGEHFWCELYALGECQSGHSWDLHGTVLSPVCAPLDAATVTLCRR